MTSHSVLERAGPRKILAIDGGGIRGIIALGAIAKIERILRQLSGKHDLVLADYFDLMAGTSTGAVIAAGLCKGMTAAELEDLIATHAHQIFRKAPIWTQWHYRFHEEGLTAALQSLLGEITLGSPELKTLLLIVLRNASTDSPWLLTNNPRAKYNDRALDDCNLDLPLWQLVRASAAAPTFFPSEVVELGKKCKTRMEFIDGGTTPYNNPSFAAFLTATLDRFRIQWPVGVDNMLLLSVGTGAGPITRIDRQEEHEQNQGVQSNPGGDDCAFKPASLLWNAMNLPIVQLWGASVEQDILCRVFGSCIEGETIHAEIDDLMDCTGPCIPKLFTYARYNVKLTAKDFEQYGIGTIDPIGLRLDAFERMKDLKAIGEVIAGKVVSTHFANFPLPGMAAPQWRELAMAAKVV
jgi:patatin-like phospholipase